MAAEKARLDEARALKRRADEQAAEAATRAAAAATPVAPTDSLGAVEVLREDEEAARAEVALAEEREELQQLELVGLQRQRNEALAAAQAIQEEHRQRLLPKLEQLQAVRARKHLSLSTCSLASCLCSAWVKAAGDTRPRTACASMLEHGVLIVVATHKAKEVQLRIVEAHAALAGDHGGAGRRRRQVGTRRGA
jgi:hypothetical protein